MMSGKLNHKILSLARRRLFLKEIADQASALGLPLFAVTEGASITRNNGSEAVRHAREMHELWEKEHGYDPNHDWLVD